MKENGKEFKVGDKAVYPAHGVGVIESIENKEFSGIKRTFYMLRVLDNDITIMIPTENIDTVGLRDIVSTKEIPRVYEILKNREISTENQTWNRRYREYMEKIKTGSVFEVAEVLRDLILIKIDKDLSFGERRILNIAKNLLVKELSIAKNISEECIRQELEDIFNC